MMYHQKHLLDMWLLPILKKRTSKQPHRVFFSVRDYNGTYLSRVFQTTDTSLSPHEIPPHATSVATSTNQRPASLTLSTIIQQQSSGTTADSSKTTYHSSRPAIYYNNI